jgi:leader peptidase (prepilin peptidase)/N-methyltransferase
VKKPRNAVAAVAVTAAVTACFLRFGLTWNAPLAAFFAAVLVVLAAIDLEQGILPNRIVLPATVIVLAAHAAIAPGHALEWVVAALAAGGFFLVAKLVYPAGLGMGDVKFGLLIGAGLGRHVATGLLIGVTAAAVAGVAILVREGLGARKKALPYGPFLAFGALVALYLQRF